MVGNKPDEERNMGRHTEEGKGVEEIVKEIKGELTRRIEEDGKVIRKGKWERDVGEGQKSVRE